ncbi:MAG: hypothetical protein RI907_2640 [Pseudomonadota bacterium]|jgi:purine-binding chemotaxis protein CheW
MSTPSAAAEVYGGFQAAGMALALPMTHLREVVPAQDWVALPCAHPAVPGGLDLRGVVVPVLDLRVVLGREASPMASPCVLIMVSGGRLLGLLAEGVSGLFQPDEHGLREAGAATGEGGVAGLMAGNMRRHDTGELVTLLSAQALMAAPGVPSVDDPEPQRQDVQAKSQVEQQDPGGLTVVMLRCGQVPLAIDAMAVYATLPEPVLLPSPLAMGHCRGVIDHGGTLVPALDLHALCGLGRLIERDSPCHAFLMSQPEGLVALLVSEVVDVMWVAHQVMVPVPAFAVPRADLMIQALPVEQLPISGEMKARVMAVGTQFLLLDAEGLSQCDEVTHLARANTQQAGLSADTRGFVQGARHATGGLAMLTYALAGETATPLAQVQEILPYSCSTVIFRSQGALLGFIAHKGHSVPVLCLSRLAGGQPPEVTPAASVLIVPSDDELIGFAVPALKSIEVAAWQPEVASGASNAEGACRSRKLAQVGRGHEERMLPVLDLANLARLVRERQVAVLGH